MATYTNTDNAGDPVTRAAIDTCVASAPTDRPSTFTPSAGYVAPTSTGQTNFGASGNDWSMGSTPTARPQCFEPQSFIATIDPGLATYG